MKTRTRRSFVLLGLAATLAGRADAAPVEPEPEAPGPVFHVVLFSLQDPKDAEALIADCRKLLPSLPGVESVSVGRKALDQREAHVKDYDVALLVRWRRLADAGPYASHPKHVELVERWKGKARWRVIDFFGE